MITQVLDAILPQRAATVQTLGHPAAGVVGWLDSQQNSSGVTVTPETALTFAAVWCANRVISETIATLPCMLYRRTGDDSRERADDDPRYWLMHDEPHPAISAVSFFETQTSHIVMTGNCYAKIVRSPRGIERLEPRQPDTVRVEAGDRELEYFVSNPQETIQSPEMLHVPGIGGDGLTGWSVVRYAASSFGAGMAADRQAAKQFANGATPNGLLIHPMRLDKTAREQLRRDWEAIHSGSENAGRVGILHGGMDFKPTSMSNEDAQFLESRQFSIEDVSRWFRVPLHMLSHLQNSSVRANIEQQAIEFITYSLRPWLCRWQQTLNRKLLSREERRELYFEFLLDALLQGDSAAQAAEFSTGRQWGWYSVNDIRRKKNMPPVDGGDTYLQPSNMVPAGTVPDTATRELQGNLAASLETIIEEAQTLRADIATGHGQITDYLTSHTVSVGESLRQLRADRELIRADIERVGKTTQVAGVTLEREQVTQVALALVREQLAGCLKIERAEVSKAARRQQEHGQSFIAFIDEFYKDHADTIAHRTSGSVGCWQRASQREAIAIGPQWCEESHEQLLTAADGNPATFCERVQSVLDTWDERLERVELCAT